MLALAINAINPGDARLLRFTAPACYASGDLYRIESLGLVNDPAGRELGRFASRELVQVAPPEALSWSMDSQADFEDRLGLGNFRLSLPNRYKSFLDTTPVPLFNGGIPDRSHDDSAGDLRLLTGELADPQQNQGSIEHFRAEINGGLLPQAIASVPSRTINTHPGVAAAQIQVLGEGVFEAWLRFESLSGAQTILFDIGQETQQNRLVCFYDSARSEIVFRVFDECLDITEPSRLGLPERRSIEARGPLAIRPNNWYHLALSWRGANYGDLAAFVDGKFITTTDRYLTFLTANINEDTIDIPVEDTAEFPARGVIRLGGTFDRDGQLQGGEVVEYVSKTANSFRLRSISEEVLRRGYSPVNGTGLDRLRYAARGSGPRRQALQVPCNGGIYRNNGQPLTMNFFKGKAHTRRCPVYVYGTVSYLRWEQIPQPPDPNTGVTPPPQNIFARLYPGGAILTQPIAERTPFTLAYRPFVPRFPGDQPTPNDIVINATDSVIQTVWAVPFPDVGETRGGFPPTGILKVGADGNHEYVAYSSINPGTGQFLGLRRGLTINGQATVARDHLLFSPITLISVQCTTDLSGYPDNTRLAVTQDENTFEWMRLRKVAVDGLAGYFNLAQVNNGPRRVQSVANAADPTWTFMVPLLNLYLASKGVLPPNTGNLPLALNSGPSKQLKEWLKRIETAANSRAQDFTGLNGSFGVDRGPGTELAANSKILPVAAVEARFGGAGRFDLCTLTDDSRLREERMVVHGFDIMDPRGQRVIRTRIALDDFVTREINAMVGGRLSKWPTGQPPAPSVASIAAPSPKIGGPSSATGGSGSGSGSGTGSSSGSSSGEGPLGGHIDEMKMSFITDNFRSELAQPLVTGAENLGARPISGRFPGGNRNNATPPVLIKLLGEVVAVTDPDSLIVKRGMLSAPELEHGAETPIWVLPTPAMTVTDSGYAGQNQEQINVRRGSTNSFLQKDGYLAVDRGAGAGFVNILAYDRRQGGGFQRPLDRLSRGVFDGCFGTGNQAGLAAGDVLIGLPFRHYDRFQDQITSRVGTCYQFSRTLQGAWIESIDWEVLHPNAYTQIVVRVIIDGEVTFDGTRAEDPATKKAVFTFKDPPDRSSAVGQTQRQNSIKRRGDQVDIQVWFTYRGGAYIQDCWKESAILRSLKLRYYQPTRVLYHEESLR